MSIHSNMGDEPVTVWDANARWTEQESDTVLVPLVDGTVPQPALTAARTLATGNETDLMLLNAVCYPEQTPFALLQRTNDDYQETVQAVTEAVRDANPSLSVSSAVHLGRTRAATVADAVETHDIGAVVVDQTWSRSRLSPLTRSPVERLTRLIDCPILIASGAALPTPLESILVATSTDAASDGPHEVAASIAKTSDVQIDRCHVPPTSRGSDRHDQFDTDLAKEVSVLEADDPAAALIEKSQKYDVVIRGAPERGRLRRLFHGPTPTDLIAATETPVLTVRAERSGGDTPSGGPREER